MYLSSTTMIRFFKSDYDINIPMISTTTTLPPSTSTAAEEYIDEIYDEDYYMAPSVLDPYVPPISPQNQNNPQSGTYYKGRLGLPTNYDFNTNVRRIQPGPRFRNGMMRPRHFRGVCSEIPYSRNY